MVLTAHAVNHAAVQVKFVATQDAGVQSAGVTRVGEVAKHKAQDHVSSLQAVFNSKDVAVSVLLHRSIVLFVRVLVVAELRVSSQSQVIFLDRGVPHGSSTRYITSVAIGVASVNAVTLLLIIIRLNCYLLSLV
jgi:hypothetical protein